MKGKSKIILLIPLLLFSCFSPYLGKRSSRSRYSGYKEKYPASSYLLGVGTSPLSPGLSVARRRAKEASFGEIAEEIRVRIESYTTDSFGLGVKEKLQIINRSTVDMILEGVRIVEATPLPEQGIYLVVAVLPRREAIDRLSQRIKWRDDELKWLMKRAREEGDLLKRWNFLSECEEVLLQETALYQELEAVAGPLRIATLPPETSLSEVMGEMYKIINPLKMIKLGGKGTEKDPLKVKVLYGSLPLPGVPLRWSLTSQRGEIVGVALTDGQGMGSAVVRGIVPSRPEGAQAEVNLRRRTGNNLSSVWGGASLPKVTFLLTSPQSGIMGAAQSLLQSLSSSGLYGIDIFVADFSPRGEQVARDLTATLKDYLAQDLLFQLVDSPTGFPYILKGRVENSVSGARIMASLTRREKVITTTTLFVKNGL